MATIWKKKNGRLTFSCDHSDEVKVVAENVDEVVMRGGDDGWNVLRICSLETVTQRKSKSTKQSAAQNE